MLACMHVHHVCSWGDQELVWSYKRLRAILYVLCGSSSAHNCWAISLDSSLLSPKVNFLGQSYACIKYIWTHLSRYLLPTSFSPYQFPSSCLVHPVFSVSECRWCFLHELKWKLTLPELPSGYPTEENCLPSPLGNSSGAPGPFLFLPFFPGQEVSGFRIPLYLCHDMLL